MLFAMFPDHFSGRDAMLGHFSELLWALSFVGTVLGDIGPGPISNLWPQGRPAVIFPHGVCVCVW